MRTSRGAHLSYVHGPEETDPLAVGGKERPGGPRRSLQRGRFEAIDLPQIEHLLGAGPAAGDDGAAVRRDGDGQPVSLARVAAVRHAERETTRRLGRRALPSPVPDEPDCGKDQAYSGDCPRCPVRFPRGRGGARSHHLLLALAGNRVLKHDARLADVAQPAHLVALEAALDQPADRARHVGRKVIEINRRAQHVGQRVRDGLALEQPLA